MRPSTKHCLAGILIIFVWSVILPQAIYAQSSGQAKIDTLNKEIKELRGKVDYWKPRLGQGGWIFVPLTKGYWEGLRGEVRNPYDVMRETGRNHWVKNTKGNYAIDVNLNTYKNQFRQKYAGKGNEWLDRQWRELMADNDRVKQLLRDRISQAEQTIANKQAQLKTLTTSPLPPVTPLPPSSPQVTQTEKNHVIHNELGPLVQRNRWHADEHIQVAGQINKAQTRHQLDVAKKYMHDCDAYRVAFWKICDKANADKKAGTISFLECVQITDAANRELQAGRYAALLEMRANW